MGSRGPAGKRSSERVRKEEPAVPVRTVRIDKLIRMDVEIPEPDEKWHNTARGLYDSFASSAQSVYYEPSDWHLLYMGCDNLSRLLKPQFVGFEQDAEYVTSAKMMNVPLKGTDMSAFLKLMTMLGATETDRRRAGIEIERAIHATDMSGGPEGKDATVTDLFADRDSALSG